MKEHVVFFDEECPVCHKGIQLIIQIDKDHRIQFASLRGETASCILTGPLKYYTRTNSLVLIENYQSTERKFWIRSRALMRVYWLVGNGWGLFGWLSFLPGWLSDRIYRKLGHHRHQFKLKMKEKAASADRFLP
jgi:predicted DCC family thiol-disulfide oxidoreductase YuxK